MVSQMQNSEDGGTFSCLPSSECAEKLCSAQRSAVYVRALYSVAWENHIHSLPPLTPALLLHTDDIKDNDSDGAIGIFVGNCCQGSCNGWREEEYAMSRF